MVALRVQHTVTVVALRLKQKHKAKMIPLRLQLCVQNASERSAIMQRLQTAEYDFYLWDTSETDDLKLECRT